MRVEGQQKDNVCHGPIVCVFITAVPITKLFAKEGGEGGGHVLRETTRRGLCVFITAVDLAVPISKVFVMVIEGLEQKSCEILVCTWGNVNMHQLGVTFVESVLDVQRRNTDDDKTVAQSESLEFLAQIRGLQSEDRKQRRASLFLSSTSDQSIYNRIYIMGGGYSDFEFLPWHAHVPVPMVLLLLRRRRRRRRRKAKEEEGVCTVNEGERRPEAVLLIFLVSTSLQLATQVF